MPLLKVIDGRTVSKIDGRGKKGFGHSSMNDGGNREKQRSSGEMVCRSG